MSLTSEAPAEGILKMKGWNDSHVYHVECSCTSPDHALQAWVEIDTEEDWPAPQLTFYVQDHYPNWNGFFRRLKDAVGILFGQPLTRSHSLLLTRQSAVNFTAALNQSIEDLEEKESDNT